MPGMPPIDPHSICIILQFLKEHGYTEAAHSLERESGLYFHRKYFGELILDGKLDEAEMYISGFTQLHDNWLSTKMYFKLRKQKYIEALNSNDVPTAVEILRSDLKVFEANKDLFKEITELLTSENIGRNNKIAMYGARSALRREMKEDIALNPALRGKLNLPRFEPHMLEDIINQSLNWQHSHCAYPVPNPVIHTLFADHQCNPPERPIVPPADDASESSQAIPMSIASPVGGPSSPFTVTLASEPRAPISPSRAANSGTHDLRTSGLNMALKENQQSASQLLDDLPMKVIRILKEESNPTGIDFHPVQHTYLLVGTTNGGIGLWELGSGVKLFSENFKVWNMEACSTKFKEAMMGSSRVSINCVIWSPDGSLFGTAYSRHLVQIYVFGADNVIKPHLEIEAHEGSVSDLAFSATDKRQFVITCSNDGTIKVWDAMDGVKQFTFEGHKAPVYSVLPHTKSGIHFILSTSVDGQIRAWLYGDFGARLYCDAPGLRCIVLTYSNDNNRLFAGGMNNDGESFLVEWDESNGPIKRSYQGMGKRPSDIAHFHTAKSFLAAGDEHMIKFWSMDDVKLLATTDAEGGLPGNPHLRFNKEGSLLAVIADGHSIKILGPNKASQLLKTSESCSVIASSVTSESLMKEC